MCEMICFDKVDRLMANRRTYLGFIVAWHMYYISTVIPEHKIAPPKIHFRFTLAVYGETLGTCWQVPIGHAQIKACYPRL